MEPRRANVKTNTERSLQDDHPPFGKMSRECVCGCWKFTSVSIGERLHPRHASSLVWTREGWRAKRWGERVGGRAEEHGRGASVWGS